MRNQNDHFGILLSDFFDTPELPLFGIAFHNHPEGDRDETCALRSGLVLYFLGFGLFIGITRTK